jgi:uncharacterized protein (DUF2126 family)
MTSTSTSTSTSSETDSEIEIDRAVAEHDARLTALGLEIWLGNEPTFTDRYSHATEWLTGAVGEDKRRRAEALVGALARADAGAAVLRCIGRQYPGESEPRSSIGLYARRDGSPAWTGPPDPLLVASPEPAADPGVFQPGVFQAHLSEALAARRLACATFSGPDDHRLLFSLCAPATFNPPDPAVDPRLLRPSIHARPLPPQGLRDELARDGMFLLVLGTDVLPDGRAVPCLDLPAVGEVELFLALLADVAAAASRSRLPALVLRGFPPPVDASVLWSTVTPDPAVVEVNAAPCASVAEFLRANRRCYAAAAALGLAPYRLYYNGTVADSGGGGQITFGGPSPARSPFFVSPHLLPRLVRYVARHPAFSYLFAHDYVGPCGQSVRPDELGPAVLGELRLALALLERVPDPAPATLWQALAPFLTDATGNSHRADLNIEKLWNPAQPGRGTLGLVELRAFRMQHTPERAAALGALVRAVLARLMTGGEALDHLPLVDREVELHDRFALPFYLEADLREVLEDLRGAGLGLAPVLARELERDDWRHLATFELGDCTLEIRRALEFWLLIGDASQQQGTSRLVDASTSRIELALRPSRPDADGRRLAAWRVQANGVELPLRSESEPRGPVRVFGVRYRSFVPRQGLHPTLGSQAPLRLVLGADPGPRAASALRRTHEITLLEWAPDGRDYADLPADLTEASTRRAARCVLRDLSGDSLGESPGWAPNPPPAARTLPPAAFTPYSVDLRFLEVR